MEIRSLGDVVSCHASPAMSERLEEGMRDPWSDFMLTDSVLLLMPVWYIFPRYHESFWCNWSTQCYKRVGLSNKNSR